MKTYTKFLFILFSIVHISAFAQYTKLLDFAGTTNGHTPIGNLISDGTFLYGMTSEGGTNNMGTVFKIMPNGTAYQKLLDLDGTSNGHYADGSLFSDGTFLYGMTVQGGTYDYGTLFKIMPNATGYVKLIDFNFGGNGASPRGSLISDGTFLYGMTLIGGANNMGTIFKIMLDGTGYLKLVDFGGTTNGSNPYGSLFSDGTFLYGMTSRGGINDKGTLFKIMPNGTGFVKLLDFAGTTNGRSPRGSLISDGTFLYGMTSEGGTGGAGILFKILPNGTGFVKLFDFTQTTSGAFPYGSLISDGTFLYGMSSNGGALNGGTLFKIMPNGTGFIKLLDFDENTNGSFPNGSLISDGTFLYGMTANGGTNSMGTIFKYQHATLGVQTVSSNLEISIYPNPTKDIINIKNPSNFPIDKIVITDLTGKKVMEQNGVSNTIDVSKLQLGLYIIKLKSNKKTIVTKFIKN